MGALKPIPRNSALFQARRLFIYMSGGGSYSTLDLMRALNIADPRAVVRDMKKKLAEVGAPYEVVTRWVKPPRGARYKLYSLRSTKPRDLCTTP